MVQWQKKRLIEIATKIGSGATPRGGKKSYKTEGVALIRSMNVHDGSFKVKDLARIDNAQADKLANVEVKKGDVLLNITGASIARCCVVPDEILPARVNQHVSIIRPDSSLVDSHYLAHLLYSPEYKKMLLTTGNKAGATREALTKTELQSFELTFPPIQEQKRIVALLDQAFADIDQARALTEQNLKNARELFESYLQQMFSQRGEEWESHTLSDLCALISGQHIEAKNYNADQRGIGYLTGPSDFGELNPIVTKWTEHPKRTSTEGDILITVKGSGVGSVNVMDAEELAISRQLMAVRPVNVSGELLYWFLKIQFDYFQSLANGAAIPGISRSDVLELKLSLPAVDKQPILAKEISEFNAKCIELKEIYLEKLVALDELKKSLLQKAFTGELTKEETA